MSIIVCDPEYLQAYLDAHPEFILEDRAQDMLATFLRLPCVVPGDNS